MDYESYISDPYNLAGLRAFRLACEKGKLEKAQDLAIKHGIPLIAVQGSNILAETCEGGHKAR